MLDASKRLRTSALIPFVPRQVMLENNIIAASAAAATKEDKKKRKESETDKESKKTKKNKTKSSKALGDGSSPADQETLSLDRQNGGVSHQEGKARQVLLASIASFLESNGFARTLSVFRSEAQLEDGDITASFINLEDQFCKYFDSSQGHVDATFGWTKEKDLEKGETIIKNEENIHDASEPIHKKKRKHKNDTDDENKVEINGHGLENGSTKCLKVKSKKKEKNRSTTESCPAENTTDQNISELNGLGDIKDSKKTKHEGSLIEAKDKKRKKKSGSDSHEEDAKKTNIGDSHEAAQDTNHDNLLPETDANDKAKRKKRHKMSSDACNENTEHRDHKNFQASVEENIQELKSLVKDSSALPVESNTKYEGKKKKKMKATSDSLSGNTKEEYPKEDLRNSDHGMENTIVSEEKSEIVENKTKKKRKRSASEEVPPQAENETLSKKSKHVEFEGAENNKETLILQKPDKSFPVSEHSTAGKKRKTEKNTENSKEILVMSPREQHPSAQDMQKDLGANLVTSGKLEKDEKEGEASSKSMKKDKRSAEPKTVNAFQRVKIDEVKFADERLQDNSYWALDGTGSGYGAKAQEVLGQVRGRDFRHEKTKKKRGTYRGGQIDLQAHSIKFNYSDEE